MKTSENITNLLSALSEFHKEINSIHKDSTNPFFKSKYASLDTIIQVTKPILTKNDLVVIQCCENEGVTTTIFHVISGEWMQGTVKIEPEAARGLSLAQAYGVSVTYTKRYALSAMLFISTDEDTDGNGPVPPQTKQTTRKPPAPLQKATIPNKNNIIKVFSGIGITSEMLAEHLNHEVSERDAIYLRKVYASIKNGTKSWIDYCPAPIKENDNTDVEKQFIQVIEEVGEEPANQYFLKMQKIKEGQTFLDCPDGYKEWIINHTKRFKEFIADDEKTERVLL